MSEPHPDDPYVVGSQNDPRKPKRRHTVRNIVLGAGTGVIAIIVIAAAAASFSGPSGQPVQHAKAAATSSSPAAPEPVSSQVASVPASTAPSFTTSQQQAIDSAQSYLNGGEGFSQYSLTQQLTSQYGEGFSAADAEFAINYLNPDWYQQARESAQNYLDSGQGFSRSDLLEQLTSKDGEGFTTGQAEYAVRVTMGS
jgi:hypothetical protein